MGKINNLLGNYQSIPRQLIFDNDLSDRARFVYCFMASKPEDWDFYLSPMAKELGYSVDTLRKYIQELVDSGWLTKGVQSNEGSFGAVEYTINPTKKPYTEISDTRETHHKKKDIEDNKEIGNKEEIEDKSSKKKTTKFDARVDLSYVSAEHMDLWNEWLDYKDEIGKPYKTQKGAVMQYNSLIKYADNNAVLMLSIVRRSIENSWEGLFAIDDKLKAMLLSDKNPYTDGNKQADKVNKDEPYYNEKGELVIGGVIYR